MLLEIFIFMCVLKIMDSSATDVSSCNFAFFPHDACLKIVSLAKGMVLNAMKHIGS